MRVTHPLHISLYAIPHLDSFRSKCVKPYNPRNIAYLMDCFDPLFVNRRVIISDFRFELTIVAHFSVLSTTFIKLVQGTSYPSG